MTDKTNSRNNLINIGLTKSNEADHVANEGEDSSYDSDNETVNEHSPHQNVSRTTSDTLGQEFAEYVEHNADRSINYTQRVEFALKLGYTERLVQTALARLGANPTQNELLAELIKLGAQQPQQPGCNVDDVNSITASTIIDDGNNDENACQLRPIVIDGSNVAMGHGNKEVFSCRGIRICVDWFKNRGHRDITVFVPKWRKESARPDNPIRDQEILNELEKERMLVFTPSRLVGGKRMIAYDDRYILKLAVDNNGIIVSNDNYRDLLQESSEFKKVVEERVLMYSFVNDRFMPPDDPMGKHGPTLDNFLKLQPKKIDQSTNVCPYGKKCTYGNKCKFFHPERGLMPHKSVTERLSEHLHYHLQARNSDVNKKQQIQGKSLSVPLNNNNSSNSNSNSCSSNCSNSNLVGTSSDNFHRKQQLCRTRSNVPGVDSAGTNSQQQQQQHLVPPNQPQQKLGSPQYMLPPNNGPCWDTSPTMIPPNMDMHPHLAMNQQQHFLKSHSIESIPREMYPQNYGNNIWSPSPSQSSQDSQSQNQDSNDINLHKKLQRQLTLNPSGCDPRLYQMQQQFEQNAARYRMPPNTLAVPSAHSNDHFQQQLSPHKPLTASLSGGCQSQQHSPYEMHQHVTRIASAPNSSNLSLPWSNQHSPTAGGASTSEPHINCWPQPIADQRRKLHYHLSSIFPKEQVETVMEMYPDEVNPQKICSAILNFQNLKKGP